MSINSTTETSRRDADSKVEDSSDIREEYRQIKAREMEEMQAIMDAIKESKDPAIRHTWRRPVTDIKNILVRSCMEINRYSCKSSTRTNPSKRFRTARC